ncbi:MAG TPA: DUF4278 domain-containing protein [Kamptonema sp.]|nr:DUF4278 domain-containing protein [Kamptonema sp.]
MTWLFISPLAIALVVTYLFKNSANEAAYLGGSIITVSLIVSLILAPWQVKILLVLILLLITSRLLQSFQPLVDEESKTIKLIYRGTNYEVTPPTVDLSEEEIVGKYRGQVWKAQKLKNAIPRTTGIKYRGVTVKPEKCLTSVEESETILD